ncbi:MAG TPA: tripartite tricarboxylate transporter substrate binding protein [Burkholderiaceae bacterium]|nr:tripartite tricarboxylate transporter substrate binding protein [Burkholderiaceae bacterium]
MTARSAGAAPFRDRSSGAPPAMSAQRRRRPHLLLAALLSCGFAAFAAPQARAQELIAGKPLRIIAPAAPGGILDQTSRTVARYLGEQLKVPVVVENVPGAGGTLGIQAMLRAEPDGHTLVMGSLGPNAANYTLQEKLPYRHEDLASVIHVLAMPNVLVATPTLGAKTVADLRNLAARSEKGLSMAVSTSGSSGHLAGGVINIAGGRKAVNVVYRGAAPALTDLMSGQVDFMVDNMITALPQVRSGRLTALAVTTRERAPELPDVPTLAESGLPGIDVSVWLGLFVSAKTSPAMVALLNRELQKTLTSPEVRQRFAEQGGRAIGGSAEAFDRFVLAERERWAQVIRAAGMKAE